ncbi:MAG: exodeoxyribonuclease V subunit beta [Methylovulum sp.]|nr:exodeoxyribonuclease V subunit beta [Methylovulum sp.]
MTAKPFDPVETELRLGVNLIEASAGTGKTYAIAMLVLRFVGELGMTIEELLVVTFTKAATEELKERVRARLAEARRALAGHSEGIDSNVIRWLDGLAIDPALVKQRVDLALLDIDQASVFTIHGFCQRVLREHALESGQLFDAELTGDLAVIKQACADDFWRRQIYPRTAWEVAALTTGFKTPDALLASVDRVNGGIAVYPEQLDLAISLAQLKQAVASAADQLDGCLDAVCGAGDKFKASYRRSLVAQSGTLKNWLHGACLPPEKSAFALLTANGLREGLDGVKFRSNKTQSSDERKNTYLTQLAIDTAAFDALADAFKQLTLTLRRALLETLRTELDKRLQQLNVLSFDDLISRLSETLQGEKSALLIAQLQQRFKAALIDEFQDTDQSQWFIFSSLFAAPSQYLYLIGDPKQAIYKFRGADIYSYLDAQKQAEHQFTLGKNWRSHPQLVDAVNALFKHPQAFLLDDLAFKEVKPALSAEDGALQQGGQALAPMMLWQLPPSDGKNGYWTEGKAAAEIRLAVINEIVRLLNGDFILVRKQDGIETVRKIQPQDIAILVRTNQQAQEYQAALRAVGVPSVLNNTESVFTAQEAADLYVVLQAVAHPGDVARLKEMLALSWFGMDGQALYQTINNEAELDAWMSRFLGYFQDWQQSGLMTMMQHLFGQENVKATLAASELADRCLTNLQHVIELVQQAAVDEHLGINKTLDWLHNAITQALQHKTSGETQLLRLETDEDAVNIVTMHRAKGLEYPLVFCPYLWYRSPYLNSEQNLITCHEQGQMIADLGSEAFEAHRAQALMEELAEDLRVFYVAVTRAKYRCYLIWGDVRSADKANDSAMAHLLAFAEADFAAQQAKLKGFSEQSAAFAYQLLDVPGQPEGRYQQWTTVPKLEARVQRRSLYTRWQMSSYTALSALSLTDAPELPEDKAREEPVQAEKLLAELPRGAHTGNVVHDLLENTTFLDLAERKDITAQREKACLRYGLKLEQPSLLDDLLWATVSTPLSATDTDFCLKNVPDRRCLKEMPFYLAMQTMDARQINGILEGSPAYQPLSSKVMCGFLTGFIDLICAYQGRYYVMDYKTNSLPDYVPETLTHAMREHNYGLQYWLYTVVLHRYLQNRLPDYDYETHFGGVRYLFVRGMQPDVAMSGVYQDRPELERVEELAGVFSGDEFRRLG